MMLLGGIFIAAILVFVVLFFALLAAYDRWCDHYQANRRHVLHTTAEDERMAPDERIELAWFSRLRDPAAYPSMLPFREEPPLAELPAFTAHAVPDVPVNHPPLPAPVVELLGHATVDELVDSIVMRVLAPA